MEAPAREDEETTATVAEAAKETRTIDASIEETVVVVDDDPSA